MGLIALSPQSVTAHLIACTKYYGTTNKQGCGYLAFETGHISQRNLFSSKIAGYGLDVAVAWVLLLCHLSTYWLQKCDYRVEKTIFWKYVCVCVAIQKPPFPLISLAIANFCNTPPSPFARGKTRWPIHASAISATECLQFAVQVVFAPAEWASNYVSITSARTLIARRSITTLTWNRTLGIQTVPAEQAQHTVWRWNTNSFLQTLCKNCTFAKFAARKIIYQKELS